MTDKEVLDEFRDADALLEGHFVLSSGLHSKHYLQCARIMMDPRRSEKLCKALIAKIHTETDVRLDKLDRLVSPAMGGILVGYEMGRQTGVSSVFLERVKGVLELRRGFDIPKGGDCLIVEDIITTGKSARETIDAVNGLGGNVVGVACLIDRSGGAAKFDEEFVPLAEFFVETHPPDALPPELEAIVPVRPGSRVPA
ncbi:MAG: orotate phosphoribosyltransferase [Hyphomicrobiales bacterium]|nr:orotate phosphoribosyltransferase [Hyphomicrobiales bacterium]